MATAPTSTTAAEIERECTRLVLLFTEFVDSGRYERLRELFAPDGLFYRPGEPDRAMRVDEVIDSYRMRLGTNASMHLVTNILITPESDTTASGSVRILFYAAPTDTPSESGKGRKATMQFVGRFDDRFVRTAQGWRFAERRGEILFNV
ncbi:MAG TPA: nuclear transport factor 2 family protein [Steroidobacter sp.]